MLKIHLKIQYNHFSAIAQERTGIIKGRLLDGETQSPLIGANVEVLNTILGSATDNQGLFVIYDVPVGSYNLRFSYIGYQNATQTDVIVRPQRITFVEAELKPSTIESEAVEVSGGYFTQTDEQPLSVTGFSREEIRRAPGSAGDVSRIIWTLPSIAKINDQSNSLIFFYFALLHQDGLIMEFPGVKTIPDGSAVEHGFTHTETFPGAIVFEPVAFGVCNV